MPMKCPHCGLADSEDFAFCSECGRPRAASPRLRSSVSSHEESPAALDRGPTGPDSPRSVDLGSARLVGLEGPVEGQEFILDRVKTSIGRRADCDITVPDQSASRLHAWVTLVPSGCQIEDAGSVNGTWVNGLRLSGPQLLDLGDVVRIGIAAFTFRRVTQAEEAAAGPMTMVSEPDDDSTLTADRVILSEGSVLSVRSVEPSRPPETVPEPSDGDAERPTPVVPSAAPDLAVEPINALAALQDELGSFVERLNALAALGSALESRLSTVELPAGRPEILPEVSRLTAELEAEGGLDRYRLLENLVKELRAAPNDLKLLLRLSEELPAIDRSVQVCLWMLNLVREQA
jgi:ABC transport system ATP-binding/permease protein